MGVLLKQKNQNRVSIARAPHFLFDLETIGCEKKISTAFVHSLWTVLWISVDKLLNSLRERIFVVLLKKWATKCG
jgi:hypothetical protein